MTYGYGASSIVQSGHSVKYTYTEVKFPVSKSGKCPKCGKTRRRSTTFTATVNPFNKNRDTGVPKTYGEVYSELSVRAGTWEPDFTCNTHG